MNEADTCRRLVVPKLQAAGWETEPHRINEQVTFTDGRIVVAGRKARRRPGKRADYILRFSPDMPIAVVEAKPEYKTPGDALQQAKEYAEILGLRFAYATNGASILELPVQNAIPCATMRAFFALFTLSILPLVAPTDWRQAPAADWQAIFNGRNLDGWVVKFAHHALGDNYRDTFRVEGRRHPRDVRQVRRVRRSLRPPVLQARSCPTTCSRSSTASSASR